MVCFCKSSTLNALKRSAHFYRLVGMVGLGASISLQCRCNLALMSFHYCLHMVWMLLYYSFNVDVMSVQCRFDVASMPLICRLMRLTCVWGAMGRWRSDMLEMLIIHFGGPIEKKVSGLESCHVANPDVWDAFEVRLTCVWDTMRDWRSDMLEMFKSDFGGPIRRGCLRSRRLPRRKSWRLRCVWRAFDLRLRYDERLVVGDVRDV